MKFIYVNSQADKDRLEKSGLQLMGSNKETSLWAFYIGDLEESKSTKLFSQLDRYVFSDVLMF